jgi:hypothetical protein
MPTKPFVRYELPLPPEMNALVDGGFPTTYQLLAAATGSLPLGDLLALFCSAQAPAGVLLAVHDLAQGWRREAMAGGRRRPVVQ